MKTISIILSLFIIMNACCISAHATECRKTAYNRTDYPVEYATPISNAHDLQQMKSEGYYYLTNNISLHGVEWSPIRNFSGTLDGNGYTIDGLTSNTYGLFRNITGIAKISHLKLINVRIASKYRSVGALVGYINAIDARIEMTNCYVNGSIGTATAYHQSDIRNKSIYVGSLIGACRAEDLFINYCYSDALLFSEENVGGLVGINYGTIQKSTFDGTILHTNDTKRFSSKETNQKLKYVGGITAKNYGSIQYCAVRNVSHGKALCVGGLTGENSGWVWRSYSEQDTVSSSKIHGILVGYNRNGEVADSIYKGKANAKITGRGFSSDDSISRFDAATITDLLDEYYFHAEEWVIDPEGIHLQFILAYKDKYPIATVDDPFLNLDV